jgi:hypothetical protein
MTFEEFQRSTLQNAPPSDLEALLLALWEDARDNWDRAHEIAQEVSNWKGSWVHAYLHRKEGDIGNASYWYSRAGKARSHVSLEEEWEEIARALLAK